MDVASSIRLLYESYNEREWDRAAALLHTDATVEMPATAERLVGRDAVIAFQRAYPEPWGELTVRRVVADEGGGAAEVAILDPTGQRFAMAAFWRPDGDRLREGIEYWVTVGGDVPPPGRPTAFAE